MSIYMLLGCQMIEKEICTRSFIPAVTRINSENVAIKDLTLDAMVGCGFSVPVTLMRRLQLSSAVIFPSSYQRYLLYICNLLRS